MTEPSGARSSMFLGLGLLSTWSAEPFQYRRVPSYRVKLDSREPAGPLGMIRTIRSPFQVRTVGSVVGTSESYSGASGMMAPARANTGGPPPSRGAGTGAS